MNLYLNQVAGIMIVWAFALSMFIARSYAQVGNVVRVPLVKGFSYLSFRASFYQTWHRDSLVKDGPFLKGDDHFLVKCWFHFLNQRTRVMKVLFKLVNHYNMLPRWEMLLCTFSIAEWLLLSEMKIYIFILFVWILNRSVTDADNWWIPPYDDIPHHQVRDSKLVFVLFHSFKYLIFLFNQCHWFIKSKCFTGPKFWGSFFW